MSTVKLQNCQSEETTESVSDLRSGVEDSRSEGHLLFLVEDREKEDGAGEESGLGETCDIRYVPLEAGQSGSPSTTRQTARPAKECTAPVQALTIPHATHIPQMSVD